MRIKIQENSIDPNELKAALEEKFAGEYTVTFRSPKLIVVAKNKTVGATILVRKKSLIVNGNFATMGMQMLFVMGILLLGVLIPIIIYLVTVQRKFKAMEKEVGAYIKEDFKDKLA